MAHALALKAAPLFGQWRPLGEAYGAGRVGRPVGGIVLAGLILYVTRGVCAHGSAWPANRTVQIASPQIKNQYRKENSLMLV